MLDEASEGVWVGLHVWCHNSGMFKKIQTKGVALPPPFHFDNLKRDAPQQVLKCGADADAVSSHGRKILRFGYLVYASNENISGDWFCALSNFVSKEMTIGGWSVDFEVHCQSCLGVTCPFLLGPIDLLTWLIWTMVR